MINEDREVFKYKLVAQNASGCIAMEFDNRYFKTQKAALNAFDDMYTRKGFVITIFKFNPNDCYELQVSKIVKSTYR